MKVMKTASVEEIMKRQDYWHADLTEMIPMVQEYYDLIQEKGMAEALSLIHIFQKIQKAVESVDAGVDSGDFVMGEEISLKTVKIFHMQLLVKGKVKLQSLSLIHI